MRKVLFTFMVFIAVSCNQKRIDTESNLGQSTQLDYKPNQESIELNKKALEITMFHRDDSIKVDSAISLLDKATELDSLYFLGYVNKIQFLMLKDDYKRLLETNRKIIELRPHQLNWRIQRALILELSGEVDKANIEYGKGINLYEEIITLESNYSVEFQLEFAQSLVLANNYEKAVNIINRLRDENPDLELWESYKLQTKGEFLALMKEKRP